MAQVRFYSMRLNFQELKHLYDTYEESEFARLVFQLENPDSGANRDEYDLMAYRVGSDGVAKDFFNAQKLTRDTVIKPHQKNDKKICFANYHLSRPRIKAYIDQGSSLVDYLLLTPGNYPSDPNRYVFYKIIPMNKKEVVVEEFVGADELQPSPPANAG